MTDQQTIPAGWYPMQGDPPDTHRWWDGVQWTDAQQAVVPVQQAVAATPVQQFSAPAAFEPAVAEPEVALGSVLANDLASYWEELEQQDKVDPAAAFSEASLRATPEQEPGSPTPQDGADGVDRPDGYEGSSNPSPLAWALLPFRNFANFKGRSCRAEYWWFTALNMVVGMALFAGLVLTVPPADTSPDADLPPGLMAVFAVFMLYSVIVTIPSWAVTIRRLHDTNRSGWSVLIGAIPFIGGLWLLVIYVTPGSSGWNKYGGDHLEP